MLVAFWLFSACFILASFSEGKPPVLSEKEKTAVEKLRAALGDKLTLKYMQSDAYLVKWVKAKNFNDIEARTALEKTLQWRKSEGIDYLPFENVPSDLAKAYVVDFSYRDIYGAPIAMCPFGDWDLRKKSLAGKLSELNRRAYILDEMSAQLSFNLTGDPKTLALADANGFSLRKSACVSCLPFYITWVTHHEVYYPYNFYKIVGINAPSAFVRVTNLVKPLMSTATRNAFFIFGYDREEWTKELAKTVDLDTLPIRFGGTGKNKKGKKLV